VGALVGGLYAAGKTPKEIEQLALTTNWRQVIPLFFDPGFRRGLLKGDRLKRYIKKIAGNASFETTRMPFGAVVTDMTDAKAICLTSGDFATAIRASVSVPVLFHPEIIDGKILVDGGLSMPVPVEFVRAMGADIIIAVNLFEHYEGLIIDEQYSMNTVSFKSTDVLSHYLSLENVRDADIVVSPQVAGASLLNKFFTEKGTAEVIEEGKIAMTKQMPALKALLAPPVALPPLPFSLPPPTRRERVLGFLSRLLKR
jgi:NTE family protein